MQKIGIPRALYYHYYYVLWEHFFKDLGLEVVFSPPTNKQILELGISVCVDGSCLAIKNYLGHVSVLVQEGVDVLFVPQIISVSKGEYTCPNFLGLPDLVRLLVPDSIQQISPVIDVRKNKKSALKNFFNLGLQFASAAKVRRILGEAVEKQKLFEQTSWAEKAKKSQLDILLLGPHYILADSFLCANLPRHLISNGVRIHTASDLPWQHLRDLNNLLEKPLFWLNAKCSLGALEHFRTEIDGIITLVPFGCGAESLVGVLIADRAEFEKIPLLSLVIDEHTSELGMITRLEAFCDLLERKKANESHFSPFGKRVHCNRNSPTGLRSSGNNSAT